MKKMENNEENSGHYVVASRPPNGDRLQRRRSCQKTANRFYLLPLRGYPPPPLSEVPIDITMIKYDQTTRGRI